MRFLVDTAMATDMLAFEGEFTERVTPMSRKFGFSFSWKRVLGISTAKGKLSKAIGIPLTKGGRERKLGRMLLKLLGFK